ncbi:hypothetical protein PN441_07965 [Spirulina major CS-329]|uniref:hypothetical protein n=1 Tax=Spirulina TaxID=1154 RepID=UPI00232E779C|nr:MULTISPECIES: hypothetical protein [Spirulina]MDB9495224.1 hypothetical protein [Spirulina subsalsa CS-330]MDB9503006.1 hypothetical protein [Spirulina major CS-329]
MKAVLPPAWCYPQPTLFLSIPTSATTVDSTPSSLTRGEPGTVFTPDANSDPLNSPYPIPWTWILNTHAELRQLSHADIRYYRSPAIVSPDGAYITYSRIQMSIDDRFFRSTISSVMFLETVKTGELQTITASSPLAIDPDGHDATGTGPSGVASLLIPVSWSESGDRLLARQFEGLLSTSIASDYAVIWERDSQRTTTLSPRGIDYSNAVLLGWSHLNPHAVLFRAGVLGDDPWLLWSVTEAETKLAAGDQPTVYGQTQQPLWSGAQVN